MAFDLDALRAAVHAYGTVWRVVIADLRGSSPREIGAAMLVWADGQQGSIGGGALEFTAAQAARDGAPGISHHPLGPALGQCCGGAVSLVTERYDAGTLETLDGSVIARPVGPKIERPLKVARLIAEAQNKGTLPAPQLIDGWMVEPVLRPSRQIWIWGAGHVGRAIAAVLDPIPEIEITWVDTSPERFPEGGPDGPVRIPAADPALLVPHAPGTAEHLILTYSHALDLEICHRLLVHGFRYAGLIGSATKKARFRSRLAQLGHESQQIDRISCPIGDPALGKHPQIIAIGVATEVIRRGQVDERRKDMTA